MIESPNASRLGFGVRVVALALVFIASNTPAQQGGATAALSAEEASGIATDAYIYGL